MPIRVIKQTQYAHSHCFVFILFCFVFYHLFYILALKFQFREYISANSLITQPKPFDIFNGDI